MKQILMCATLLTVGGGGATGQPATGSPWPMEGRDARHTGRQVFTVPSGGTEGAVRWAYDTGHSIRRFQGCGAIGPDCRIYATSDSGDASAHGMLLALDQNGDQVSLAWAYERDTPTGPYIGNSISPPALGNYDYPPPLRPYPYAIYFGADDHLLRCVSTDGSLLWSSVDLGGQVCAGPVLASNGRVYVGSVYDDGVHNNFFAFTPTHSGSVVSPAWGVRVVGGVNAACAIYEDESGAHIIVGSVGRHVYQFTDLGASGHNDGKVYSIWGPR